MPDMIFGKNGEVRHIYNENLEEISQAISDKRETTRASHVEPSASLSEAAREWISDYAAKHGYPCTMNGSPGELRVVWPQDVPARWPNCWWADMLPMNGPVLGPYATRQVALDAEVEWLDEHHLLCLDCRGTTTGRTSSETPNESNTGKFELKGVAHGSMELPQLPPDSLPKETPAP